MSDEDNKKPDDNKKDGANKSEDQERWDEDKDDSNDDSNGEGTVEEEASGEKVTGQAVTAVTKAAKNIKNTLKASVKVLKAIVNLFAKLIAGGPVGWIIALVLIVFLILVLIIFSFSSDNNGNVSNYARALDVQDLVNKANFFTKTDVQADLDEVKKMLKDNLSKDELKQIEEDIDEYNALVNDYTDTSVSFYDTASGYQILKHDGNVLLMLERLSYCYDYINWEEEFDVDGALATEIEELDAEIEAEEALPEGSKNWSQIKLRNKKEQLKEMKDHLESIKAQNIRVKEYNSQVKAKIDEKFNNNEEILSKVHPDGEPVEEKVLSYFKDENGVETEEVEEELSYFHNIMKREMNFEKEEEQTSIEDSYAFAEDPEIDLSNLTEEHDSRIDLTYAEYPFRLNFELLHHETTLNLINNDTIKNSLFENSDAFSNLKSTMSKHFPIFEYSTWSELIPAKTFYEYELYSPDSFDGEGNYIFNEDFDSKLEVYTNNEETDIDFSKVELQRDLEEQLTVYQTQLAFQEAQENPDYILIEELNELIVQIEEQIGENPPSEEMLEAYEERYQTVLTKTIMLEDEDRPYDPHNHHIIKESEEEPTHYILYQHMLINSYDNKVTVIETLTKVPSMSNPTIGEWEESDEGPSVDSCTKKYKTKVEILVKQRSLQPLKVRSLLNSADYVYETETTKATLSEVKALLEREREKVKWQRRKYTTYKKVKNSQGKYVETVDDEQYEYKKETTIKFSLAEKIESAAMPFDTNEGMGIETATYLTDFYGQTELLTEHYDDTPGEFGDWDDREIEDIDFEYTPGHITLTYYNQYDSRWKNLIYNDPAGGEKIGPNACGPSCMAMIVDTLCYPNNPMGVKGMCDFCYEHNLHVHGSGTKRDLFRQPICSYFGLTSKSYARNDAQGVADALSKGHPVVTILTGNGAIYSGGGHYVVLCGIDENGLISVYDPANAANNSKKFTMAEVLNNVSTTIPSEGFWEIYR